VTSAQPRTETDVLLKNWSSSGLRVASTVRLSRLRGGGAIVFEESGEAIAVDEEVLSNS